MKVRTHGKARFAQELKPGDVLLTSVGRLLKSKGEPRHGTLYVSLGPFPHAPEMPRLYGGNELPLDRCIDETAELNFVPLSEVRYRTGLEAGTILRTEDDVLHLIARNDDSRAFVELASGRLSFGEPGAIAAVYSGYRLERNEGEAREILFAFPREEPA
jgi:hypothetical protein